MSVLQNGMLTLGLIAKFSSTCSHLPEADFESLCAKTVSYINNKIWPWYLDFETILLADFKRVSFEVYHSKSNI